MMAVKPPEERPVESFLDESTARQMFNQYLGQILVRIAEDRLDLVYDLTYMLFEDDIGHFADCNYLSVIMLSGHALSFKQFLGDDFPCAQLHAKRGRARG